MQAVFLDYETLSYSDLRTANLTHVLPAIRLYDDTTATELTERIENAEIVLLNKIKLKRAALEAAPRLRLIALISICGAPRSAASAYATYAATARPRLHSMSGA